ncbi:MAG: hypothetical protein ACRC1H_19535 [Caldilineaceae bacterium]
MPKVIDLARCERIIAVVPQTSRYDGWQVWVYIEQTNEKTVRHEVLGMGDMTRGMLTLYRCAEPMHAALLDALPVKCTPTFQSPPPAIAGGASSPGSRDAGSGASSWAGEA